MELPEISFSLPPLLQAREDELRSKIEEIRDHFSAMAPSTAEEADALRRSFFIEVRPYERALFDLLCIAQPQYVVKVDSFSK